ncbi:aminotransferase-like domain-containing protein [Paenilisteria rocourtiae]|uniref:GntR family transcriptional regulator n=1 Tax=Listeria rocourtiae TaxID=647910 RepID=A0A4R6ZSX6_9LIST|nr:PLP-dependent aminotransferase family protein [Listeria rocourtiae]EUJ43914.1 GntR family transcriptional regulator [Listeria rocourtiae FSL F6-920]MBC1605177.1 PLP-dependent aminotransferase family protein [Listeria rocourtiae]TDR55688.1 GntR family transcriptional regulator [Listeria rocourtiae]
MWKITKTESIPIYQQIIALMEDYIEVGKLLPGDRIPAERELATMLNVNRSTLSKALDELSARGIITRKQGSGTRISEDKWGVFTGQKTNWRHYVSQGSFLQATPYMDKMKQLLHESPDGVIDLASGELPVQLIPKISTPALSWQTFLAEEGSEDIAGYQPLKETIRDMIARNHDVQTNLDQIFITSGAQQALFLITQCLLTSGDAIAIESPSYFYALSIFQSAGLRIYALPMDENGVKLDELEQLYRKHRIKMVFVNPTFQNPTSLTMGIKRREALVKLCAKIQVPIVEDDPYSMLSFTDYSMPPLLKKLDPDNVLYIGSLSKIMGSTTRIGWLLGPAAVVTRLAEARKEMDFGLSIFPQVLANHVLNDADFEYHISWLRQTLQKQRDLLIACLPEGLKYHVPQGGFHLWCQLPSDKNWTSRSFDIFLEHKLLVMPAFLFGIKEPAIRLTFTRLNEEDSSEFRWRLRDIIMKLNAE